MDCAYLKRLCITYIIGFVGGWLFSIVQLPLPWILGPLTVLLLWKTFILRSIESSLSLRKISFTIMGIQIGTTFTSATLTHVIPYLIPFTLLTIIIIAISLVSAFLLTKWIPVDVTTSMLGSVPGGLSAIIALSDSLEGNTALVTILQTIRLITVLFTVPFAATHLFISGEGPSVAFSTPMEQGPLWTIVVYVAIYFIALRFQYKVPAALVIVPMLVVGAVQIIDLPLFELPNYCYICAQVAIGVHLGESISIRDLTKAGKYCLYYFGLTLLIVLLSFSFGYIFSVITNIDIATSILSFAPGGLIEMAVTAQSVRGDPSIVSSLQMIRLLTIVLILPMVLKLIIGKIKSYQKQQTGS
ncbi:AbrB family transcriptional regulator [Aquibacillus albus]|uniref:Membrane AbrB-like protein n=1 Tax=Aquibacillus albus TaxID=1168171 RepID=A0ABS2MVJ4_9BACI|nr:AbrB family transcriptional regulator [Aquibacillus albus]MBM7569894.1 membrane AbrB-like protein [Aquibacillus albus]